MSFARITVLTSIILAFFGLLLIASCASPIEPEPTPETTGSTISEADILGGTILTPTLAISYTNGVSLELLGTYEGPLDLMDSPDGILVVEILGNIYNLDSGETVFELQEYAGVRPEAEVGPHILGADYHENQIFLQYGVLAEDFEQYVISFELIDGLADMSSIKEIMSLAAGSNTLHAGGDLAFDGAGYLWVALGDGDEHGDPLGNSQNKGVLYGSLLRLDITDAGNPPDCNEGAYTIPVDNPFVDGPGGDCDELFAIGIRQPWRIDIDPISGDIWFADTGYNAREEINVLPAASGGGQNFGWSCLEGTIPLSEAAPDLYALEDFDPVPLDCSLDFVEPIFEYSHEDFPARCSIIGGIRYHGELLPQLVDHYIYTDYCSGEILALTPEYEEIVLLDANFLIDSIAVTAAGDILLADFASGAIYRLIPFDS